jgi:photosystem II stability/assembly factor-like uncharacterized protein
VAGYVNGLAVSSWNTAWLALSRETLWDTKNGGRTWRQAIPISRADPADSGVGPVLFDDVLHGWLGTTNGHMIFRTTDGGKKWESSVLS